MINDKARAALATAYRIQLEVIMIDLALRFPQDGLKGRMEGETRRTSCYHIPG